MLSQPTTAFSTANQFVGEELPSADARPNTQAVAEPSAKSLALKLRQAYLEMHRQTNARCSEFGMTADQYCLLLFLNRTGPVTQTELTAGINSDPNTISAMVRRMERQGLLHRIPHPHDSRAKLVEITPQSQLLLEQLHQVTSGIRDRIQALYSTEELETLIELLSRFEQLGKTL